MKLTNGCMHCKHLKHDERLNKSECLKFPKLKLEDAGACMVAKFGEKIVIVENCPGFESKYRQDGKPI